MMTKQRCLNKSKQENTKWLNSYIFICLLDHAANIHVVSHSTIPPSIYLCNSMHPSIYSFNRLSIHLLSMHVYPSTIYPSTNPSIWLSIHPCIHLSDCLSIYPSIHPSIHPSFIQPSILLFCLSNNYTHYPVSQSRMGFSHRPS